VIRGSSHPQGENTIANPSTDHRQGHSLDEHPSFLVRHVTPFADADTAECRERLSKNKERAVAWVDIAILKDLDGLRFASAAPPWRVFSPVNEPGPC